jgi:hypothetical protein
MAVAIWETVVQPQQWPATVWVLLITSAVYAMISLVWRPSFPKNSPKLFEAYPILGALRFFSQRGDFLVQSHAQSKTENFSFYLGKRQVIGLGGDDGRKVFFESRQLDMSEG